MRNNSIPFKVHHGINTCLFTYRESRAIAKNIYLYARTCECDVNRWRISCCRVQYTASANEISIRLKIIEIQMGTIIELIFN